MKAETTEDLRRRAIPVKVDLKECDRLTAQLAIHHEHCGEPPVQVQAHFSIPLKTVAQPYQRRMRVDVDACFVEVDLGWLKDNVGYIIIENRAGAPALVNPTDEERERITRQILTLYHKGQDGIQTSIFEIPPRGMFVGIPRWPDRLFLRSEEGLINATVTIMPR